MSGLLRVVAAAVIDDGRVLAARRSHPVELAGGWEFAGGKVEDGEFDADALRRELREELGVEVVVGAELGVARDERIELHVYRATLDAGLPTAQDDHDALRWVRASEIGEPAWLPIDRDLLDVVAAELASER